MTILCTLAIGVPNWAKPIESLLVCLCCCVPQVSQVHPVRRRIPQQYATRLQAAVSEAGGRRGGCQDISAALEVGHAFADRTVLIFLRRSCMPDGCPAKCKQVAIEHFEKQGYSTQTVVSIKTVVKWPPPKDRRLG